MPRTKGSKARSFPVHNLRTAMQIIEAIVEKGAGQAMDRLLVAEAIGRTPGSSEFKRLLSSSRAYGLTQGTEKADFITPTELGIKIAKPTSLDESTKGMVEAAMTPDVMGRVYRHFNRNKLPDAKFLRNTLEKSFDINVSHSEELAELLTVNAAECGILQNISGSKYIRIEDPVLQKPEDAPEGEKSSEEDIAEVTTPAGFSPSPHAAPSPESDPTRAQKPRQLFVAHGKNKKPMEELKKILDQFGIDYKVAVDEPHAGRPISKKVAQLMEECSAGIFVFTKDEKFFRKKTDGEHEEVWRPSENVVYELGAASVLWDRKIIILREEGVNFPSDFSDLGYITFDGGGVTPQALSLMKELVALGLVKVLAA